MGKPTDPNLDADDAPPRDADDHAITRVVRRALRRKHGALPSPSDLDDDLLLRYLDGAVSASERETIERRLLVDLDAKERLGILAGALNDLGHGHGYARPAVPEGVVVRSAQTAVRYVFHVASGLIELLRGGEGATVLVPEAAVRSGMPVDTSRPAAYQIERLYQTTQGPVATRFELHAEQTEASAPALGEARRALPDEGGREGPPLIDLVVHVVAGAGEGMRVKLLRDGRPIDSQELEATACTFSRLGPARYDIELRKGGVEIGHLLLDLRGAA